MRASGSHEAINRNSYDWDARRAKDREAGRSARRELQRALSGKVPEVFAREHVSE